MMTGVGTSGRLASQSALATIPETFTLGGAASTCESRATAEK